MWFQFIEESGLECLTKIGIVEIFHNPPEAVIRETAFSEERVDMWIPFQRPAKGMEDTEETRDKVFTFIQRVEHSEYDTAYSLKEAVKEGAVIEKERPQLFQVVCSRWFSLLFNCVGLMKE